VVAPARAYASTGPSRIRTGGCKPGSRVTLGPGSPVADATDVDRKPAMRTKPRTASVFGAGVSTRELAHERHGQSLSAIPWHQRRSDLLLGRISFSAFAGERGIGTWCSLYFAVTCEHGESVPFGTRGVAPLGGAGLGTARVGAGLRKLGTGSMVSRNRQTNVPPIWKIEAPRRGPEGSRGWRLGIRAHRIQTSDRPPNDQLQLRETADTQKPFLGDKQHSSVAW
jgi:hypothetical protein